ncbi:unnamed protein product [Brassica rapa subsp. trilocularis]
MSSGESHLSLKMVLFLASQICHNSQGAKQLFETPVGGKLTFAHRLVQLPSLCVVLASPGQ